MLNGFRVAKLAQRCKDAQFRTYPNPSFRNITDHTWYHNIFKEGILKHIDTIFIYIHLQSAYDILPK